jgi:hypothetical protein
MTMTRDNQRTLRKTCSSTTSLTKNPIRTGLGLNPGLRSDRLVPFAFHNTDGQDTKTLILFIIIMFCTGFGINERKTFLTRRLIKILYLQAERTMYGTYIEF